MLFTESERTPLSSSSHVIRIRIERLVMALWTYTQRPPGDWFYGGNTGLVIVPILPFFLAGCWFTVWRLCLSKSHWQPGTLLILMWLLATAAGNSLLINPSETARYVVAFPAVALVVAVGIRALSVLLVPYLRSLPALPVIAMMGIAVLLASAQVYYYFGVHVKVFNQQSAETMGYDDMLWRLAGLPPDTHVHLVFDHTPYLDDYNVTSLLAFHQRQQDVQYSFVAPDELTIAYLQELLPQQHHAFFIRPIDTSALRLMEICCRRYGPTYSTRSVNREQQYAMYLIPAVQLSDDAST